MEIEDELFRKLKKFGNVEEYDLGKNIFKSKITQGNNDSIDNLNELLETIGDYTKFKKVVRLSYSKNNFNIILKK